MLNYADIAEKGYKEMIREYQIYQINHEHDNAYMPFSWAEKHGGIHKADYKLVYQWAKNVPEYGSIYSFCEQLFEEFNLSHPANYKGRSMSVSDVVVLTDFHEGNGTAEKYVFFCDSLGWVDITKDPCCKCF